MNICSKMLNVLRITEIDLKIAFEMKIFFYSLI